MNFRKLLLTLISLLICHLVICYCENVLLQIAACPHYITNTVHCTQSHHHFLDLLCSPSTVAHAVSAAQTRFSPASLRFPALCPLFIKVQISSSIHLYNATEKINDKSKCPYYMNARKKNNERRRKKHKTTEPVTIFVSFFMVAVHYSAPRGPDESSPLLCSPKKPFANSLFSFLH